MKIAILGGSFDPPHRGHVLIAKRLIRLFNFDEIWLMPCYKHPFNKNLSLANDRLQMSKYLKGKSIKISGFELKRKKTSYTIDTLEALAKARPKDHFSWIIGTDQIESFTKWKNWQKLIKNFRLIVVPRTDFNKAEVKLKEIEKLVPSLRNITLISRKKFIPVYVSSALVRKRIREKKSITKMVSKKVENYIIEHKLYL